MDDRAFTRLLMRTQKKDSASLTLDHGSRVAVIGGGPAGSFFSYFLLEMAERIGLKIHVDIYEPRDFDVPGPAGCNMCGGVIYESLVQSLAVEGINLPPAIVQRGIVCNMLHLDIGSAQIQTPRNEKRIATTFRGTCPRGKMEIKDASLDGYLIRAAVAKGARHIYGRVAEVRRLMDAYAAGPVDKLLQIKIQGGVFQTYELLAVTKARVPRTYKAYLTVWHEIVLRPGDMYTLPPNAPHWFQACDKGAVVSEFSSTSTDENDIYTDPRVRRVGS